MIKADMLTWLRSEFDSWWHVHNEWSLEAITLKPVSRFGWYATFDGPSIGEMYLTNVNPMSDKSGDVITIAEFNYYIG